MVSLPLPRLLAVSLAVITVFAAWLRIDGLDRQFLQDDEWHALNMLVSSGYARIFQTFGYADHSIPLTLLYKAMADTIGLDEVRMRALQAACGIAVVPLCGALAWRVLRDAPAAALFAFLVADAPFLVLYSRFARPYPITLLLTVIGLAALWRWRRERRAPWATLVIVCAALSTWLHPIAGLFLAVGCLFVFFEDVLDARATGVAGRAIASMALGLVVAAAMLAPLIAPLLADRQSLLAKAGGDHPGVHTLVRMFSIFLGGATGTVMAIVAVLVAVGAARLWRRDRRLAAFLLALMIVPPAVLMTVGAQWSQQGHTFGRYVLPVQLLVLFFASAGATWLAQRALPRLRWAPAAFAVLLGAADAWATPTIALVHSGTPWFSHLYYHYDYVPRYNAMRAQFKGIVPSPFYRRLGELAPGTAPIVEAPFNFEAPANALVLFAEAHRQPITLGLLDPVCSYRNGLGRYPAHDDRFRFHRFVFLDDEAAVRRTGARYLVFHFEPNLFPDLRDAPGCIAKLSRLYGEPVYRDAGLVAFDLRAGDASRSGEKR
jgi:hypothetical protein